MCSGQHIVRLIVIGVVALLIPACSSERPDASSESGSAMIPAGKTAEKSGAAHDDKMKADGAPANVKEPPLGAVERGEIHFTSMLDQSGIDFVHTSGNSPEKAFPAANGSGVAALDYDLDGNDDLYFANGTTFPIDPSRLTPADHFYRNLGQWKFTNVTALCGLGFSGYSAGLATGDFNNDGFPDLYVTVVGRNQLYCNLGDGTFEAVSEESGTDDPRWATSAAFLDFDNDGLLDLYVCNYGQWSFETNKFCGDPERTVRMFCSPTMVPPERDVLFRNQGDGTFLDVSESTGLNVRSGRGQGVLAADLNEDHLIDLYVANDIHPNFLYVNDGQGHFREIGEESGTAYDHHGQAQAGMGLALGDVDRNGHQDLFVTNYQNEHNSLYENLGAGTFLETGTTRIPEGSLPYVGWGTALADFDLDGWLDLIVTNGHTDDNLADLGREGVYLQPPGLWKNQSGQFVLAASGGGAYFNDRHCGRGLAISDLDNDGDSDVVVIHQDQRPALLRNDSHPLPTSRSLQLRLIGNAGNRDAIGAVIEVESAQQPQVRTVFGGGSYESASDRRVIVGVEDESEVTLRIRWPNGTQSTAAGLKVGSALTIVGGETSGKPLRIVPASH